MNMVFAKSLRNRVRHALPVTVFLLLLACPSGPAGAESGPMDFAVIQPGAPGNASDAAPFMELLGRYIADRESMEKIPVGVYINRTEEGVNLLAAKPPAWGILSLVFFLEVKERFSMHPVASTRPSGKEKDAWRLLVSSGNSVLTRRTS